MGILKWYKRDPRAALRGMGSLTLEERGAYNAILDMIYVHDGALPDDSREICHELRCKPQTWKRIKARLLELGKLYIHAGCLRNERADREAENALNRVQQSAVAATKRWATYNEIKSLRNAPAMPSTSTSTKILSYVPASQGKPRKQE